MKICFFCDLHLPTNRNALQYDALDWLIFDLKEKSPDLIIYAGDITCFGNKNVYLSFIEKLNSIDIPFLFIPGNSDLRDRSSCELLKTISSPILTVKDGVKIFAINDCDRTISEQTFMELEKLDNNSIIFMHHPTSELLEPYKSRFLNFRKNNPLSFLFFAHNHIFNVNDKDVSLPALDPDKSIGSSPAIVYFDSKSQQISLSFFDCPMPKNFVKNLGLSVYDFERDIGFAIENHIAYLELRPDCYNGGDLAVRLIKEWKKTCGKQLSIHLPEIGFENQTVILDKNLDNLLAFAKEVKASRFTQHVPLASLKNINQDQQSLDKIAKTLCEKLLPLGNDITLGVENMHMTEGELADDSRRFGYTPEECISFMNALKKVCPFSVGINFDIGHARNNAPFSSMYQISTWLEMVGNYTVGYHIHQVTLDDNGFNNHMPITDVYGSLISYASLFKCLSKNKINSAPLIMEMRPNDAYPISFCTFKNELKNKTN